MRITLSDSQRRQIVRTAATLTPAARGAFIYVVESTLSQHCLGRVGYEFRRAAGDQQCAEQRPLAAICPPCGRASLSQLTTEGGTNVQF
jgi:hypothetical protein